MSTNQPRMYNKYQRNDPAAAVYVGRGTFWHRLYYVLTERYSDPRMALEKYEIFCRTPGIAQRIRTELKGKDLVCVCAPWPCHGDVLLKIANEEEE